jgi:hypothetical protein
MQKIKKFMLNSYGIHFLIAQLFFQRLVHSMFKYFWYWSVKHQ